MRAKSSIKGDLVEIKKELRALNSKERKRTTKLKRTTTKMARQARGANSTPAADKTNESLVQILKYFIDESKATRTQISKILEKLEQFEGAVPYEESDLPVAQQEIRPQTVSQPEFFPAAKEILIPRPDAKIITFIQQQHRSMACAEDVRKAMGYKGKNAASSRLIRLARAGMLERTQVGHRVYYRFTGGTPNERIHPITPEIEEK